MSNNLVLGTLYLLKIQIATVFSKEAKAFLFKIKIIHPVEMPRIMRGI